MADVEEINEDVKKMSLNGETSKNMSDVESETTDPSWGLPMSEVYKIAVKFYKEKEGKAMHLTYKDKLRLVALTKQVTCGPYSPGVSSPVGFLDVVGNDRIKVWQSLGDISKDKSMLEFVELLNKLCPTFKPYAEAHKREKEEQERLRKEEIERQRREEEEAERQRLEEEARQKQQQQQQKQLNQELQIRSALNQQTAQQFKQYAEQHCPGNTQQQEELIKQLQEQHFQQYMQQVYQQQLLHQQQQYNQIMSNQGGNASQQSSGTAVAGSGDSVPVLAADGGVIGPQSVLSFSSNHIATNHQNHQPHQDGDDSTQNGFPAIAAPSMWSRKDIKEFKDSLRKDTDSVIKVGSGETVTVRVPTHEDGTCLFWEFATDNYDLGFGVYFEWTVSSSSKISVQVSESSDEEELEDEQHTEGGSSKGDVEKGGDSMSKKDENRPPTDEIIPIYRRDCQQEVYCGSHMYPGRGVYLLKFDNSYSLWRSKTLYYRVYYTR